VPAIRTEEFGRPPSPEQSAPRFYPYESPEVLGEITENLRLRVDNWHGLDFSRYNDWNISENPANLFIGLENFDYMVLFMLEKINRLGKNWNASSSLRCSSASKRRRYLEARNGTTDLVERPLVVL
jgi:hypothetical protein